MTTQVDELIQDALTAQQRSQSALVLAVQEARTAGWSWEKISTSLGGFPTADTLSRAFGEVGAGGGGCGGNCACGGHE